MVMLDVVYRSYADDVGAEKPLGVTPGQDRGFPVVIAYRG